MENVIENNKLMAEFMGATPLFEGSPFYQGLEPYPHRIHISAMEFHTSWDWLMPVVEKIHRETDGFVTIKDRYCKIHNCNIGVMEDIIVDEVPTIEAVYKAVIQFITWHNLQTT